ncbi:hypothetical protein RKD49_002367 [Streptomyces glaucescens]
MSDDGSGRGRVWTALCAAVTVVLGPAAVTASALDEANAAPPHPTSAGGPGTGVPPLGRRPAPAHSLNRYQSRG